MAKLVIVTRRARSRRGVGDAHAVMSAVDGAWLITGDAHAVMSASVSAAVWGG